jgi:hypothetical protein
MLKFVCPLDRDRPKIVFFAVKFDSKTDNVLNSFDEVGTILQLSTYASQPLNEKRPLMFEFKSLTFAFSASSSVNVEFSIRIMLV